MNPEGMNALVTGANRGIGLEVVRQLLERGMNVALGSRDVERGEAALRQAGFPEERALVVPLDVSRHEASHFDDEIGRVAERFGGLDVLVNNAGVDYDTYRRASTADVSEVQKTFDVNLFGAWRTVVAARPHLEASSSARIVMVSSGAGALHGMSGGTPAYAASKAALNVLTIKLAAELREHEILCNAVCPGWVATEMGGGGRPIPEGARGVVWAATLPDDGPTGGFFRDGAPIPW